MSPPGASVNSASASRWRRGLAAVSDYLSARKGTTIDPMRALGYRVSLNHKPWFVDNGETGGSMSPLDARAPAKTRFSDVERRYVFCAAAGCSVRTFLLRCSFH